MKALPATKLKSKLFCFVIQRPPFVEYTQINGPEFIRFAGWPREHR